MVTSSLTIAFYRERIEDNLAQIRYLARDIGEMGRIREGYLGDEWEVEEFTRHIVFDANQIMQSLMEEIERDRRTIKELGERNAEGL